MKPKLFILILILSLLRIIANAQTTPVNIIDFIILPAFNNSSTQQNDTVLLNVMFKTDSASHARKAILFIGTSTENSDVKLLEADFTNINDTTFITYSGITKPIINFATNISVKLSQQQYNSYSFATLFVEDENGIQTEHLYFQKH